jgi:hypothetical protein
MRSWLPLALVLLGGCATHPSYFESNAGGAPGCHAARSDAGRYRCEAWALIEASQDNGTETERLKAAAATRFQVADGLDRGSMTPEEAAKMVGSGPVLRAAAGK